MKRPSKEERRLKKKSAKLARMKVGGFKSQYARNHAGGRFTPNSPFHEDYVTDYSHPQAVVALRALDVAHREDKQRQADLQSLENSL